MRRFILFHNKRHPAEMGAPELPEWARHPEERTRKPAPEEADKPTPPPAQAPVAEADVPEVGASEAVIIPFGRYKGKPLTEVKDEGWLKWLANTFEPRSAEELRLQEAARSLV